MGLISTCLCLVGLRCFCSECCTDGESVAALCENYSLAPIHSPINAEPEPEAGQADNSVLQVFVIT